MKTRLLIFLCGLAGLLAIPVLAQEHPSEMVVWPESSVEHEHDIGLRAHTNHLILLHPQAGGGSPTGLNPDVIRTAYGLPAYTLGQAHGAKTIAIVDAYDYPTALKDFNAFSAEFGLPQETGDGPVFKVVYADGTQPAYNSGWSQEEALDIQWAHALAPAARIVLVEAASNGLADLLRAVDVASNIIVAGGGTGEVSMSWGSGEFSAEASYDSHFSVTSGIVYFAASGDSGGKTIWPSASSNVVSAGGTTLTVSSSGISETGWSGSGGGPSRYVARPSYQNSIQNIVGAKRGTPDLSFDADPHTGVSVYWQGGWYVFGGTSVSSPSLAGIVNLAASLNGSGFATGTLGELTTVYANSSASTPNPISGSAFDFRDIISGTAGRNRSKTGWDFVTGIGSSWGVYGK